MKNSTFCLFFIVTLCCFLSACQGQYSGKKQPKAIAGILDLSEWDFDKDGTLKLDGEWEYYEGQLLTPDSFRIKPGPEKTSFREALPRRLNFNEAAQKKQSGQGKATFRLTIKFKDTNKIYGLEPVHFLPPNQLWADGKPLYPSVGMGENQKTILSQFLTVTTTFHATDQTAEIILQTANPFFVRLGLARSIEIGTESQIAPKSNNKLVINLFLYGSLLILALYHFYLFCLRRKEVYTLYLAGLCILTAFLFMMPMERFLVVLWPNSDGQIAGKLEYISVYLGLAIFVMYIASIYFHEFSKKMIWAAYGFVGLLTVLTLTTDMASQPYTMIVGGLTVFFFSFYLVLVLIRAVLKKRDGAVYSLAALIFLLVIIINDILYNQEIIPTGRFLPYGGFIFVLAQSLILGLRFQKTFDRIDAYERFVPKEFLRNLGKDAIDDVKLGDNVEKEMTVLFSDTRNFTPLSENMTPKETFKFINSYLNVMGPVIRNNHGFIDKFIGDAIMALFDSADDAVRGGRDMLQSLAEYNKGRERANYPPVGIGIGINTGILRMGTVGERGRMEVTVISDAVNLASRIEGMTKIYGIPLLISDATYHALEEPTKYHIRKIDRVKPKGKTELVTLWEVFDLDPPDLIDYKLKIAAIFEEAISLYHSRQFEEAHELFLDCLTRNPRDKTAEFYVERCKLYMKIGNEEEWGGITRRVIYERD